MEGKQEGAETHERGTCFSPQQQQKREASDVHLFCRQRSSVAAMLRKRTLGIFLNPFQTSWEQTSDPGAQHAYARGEARVFIRHEVSKHLKACHTVVPEGACHPGGNPGHAEEG